MHDYGPIWTTLLCSLMTVGQPPHDCRRSVDDCIANHRPILDDYSPIITIHRGLSTTLLKPMPGQYTLSYALHPPHDSRHDYRRPYRRPYRRDYARNRRSPALGQACHRMMHILQKFSWLCRPTCALVKPRVANSGLFQKFTGDLTNRPKRHYHTKTGRFSLY